MPTGVSVVYRVSSVDHKSGNTATLPFGQRKTTACLSGQTEILNTDCLLAAVTIRCHSIYNSWSTKLSKHLMRKRLKEINLCKHCFERWVTLFSDNICSVHTHFESAVFIPACLHPFIVFVSSFDRVDLLSLLKQLWRSMQLPWCFGLLVALVSLDIFPVCVFSSLE